MFSGPVVTRQYATDISRTSSVIEYPPVRRVHWPSRVPAIIVLTFMA